MSVSPSLLVGALGLRAGAAAASASERPGIARGGAFALPVATWAAAASAGVAAPAWVAVLAGAAAVAAHAASGGDARWVYGVDAAVVVAGSAVFVSSTTLPGSVLLAAVVAAAWLAVDRLARAAGPVLRWGLVAVAAAVLAVGGEAYLSRAVDRPLYPLPGALPRVAFIPECGGERVEIPPRSVAWLERPPGEPPHPAALLLHGAHPRGARQPAACAIRAALSDRGYAVLALDHPGFGASAPPDSSAPIRAWDPVVPARAALDWIRRRPDLDARLVVGHSMGTVDAIRLAGGDPRGVRAVVLIGSSIPEGGPPEDWWYRRFQRERGLSYRLPRDAWREIERRYYRTERALESLGGEGPETVFVTVEREWDDLAGNRGEVFRRLPPPRRRVRLEGASHYLNTFGVPGAVATDGGVLRDLRNALPPAR